MKKRMLIVFISIAIVFSLILILRKPMVSEEQAVKSGFDSSESNAYGVEIGDWLYIPSESYITHGKDDIVGGLAQVSGFGGSGLLEIEGFVEFVGFEGNSYNLDILMEQQQELEEVFGDQKAYNNPDLRPEFNTDESDFTIYDRDGLGLDELKEILKETDYQTELEKDADKIEKKFE